MGALVFFGIGFMLLLGTAAFIVKDMETANFDEVGGGGCGCGKGGGCGCGKNGGVF